MQSNNTRIIVRPAPESNVFSTPSHRDLSQNTPKTKTSGDQSLSPNPPDRNEKFRHQRDAIIQKQEQKKKGQLQTISPNDDWPKSSRGGNSTPTSVRSSLNNLAESSPRDGFYQNMNRRRTSHVPQPVLHFGRNMDRDRRGSVPHASPAYELSLQPRTVEFVSYRGDSAGSPNRDESNDFDSEGEEHQTPFNLSSPRTTAYPRENRSFPKESKSAHENRLRPQPSPSKTPLLPPQQTGMYIEDEDVSEDEDDPELQIACSTSPQAERNPQQTTSKAPKKSNSTEEHDKEEPNAGPSPESAPSISLPYSEDNLEETVLTPAPQNCIVRCRISRDKRGMDRGIYPTYFLHMERPGHKDCFLLAGRKRKKRSPNYVMSCDATDLSRNGDGFVGKVRANFVGSQFTIYDNGARPKSGSSGDQARRELAAVVYGTNLLGLRGPRKMSVIIPSMNTDHQPVCLRPTSDSDSMVERFNQHKLQNLVVLHNKTPVWNADSQSYVLNFHGRVKQASVKNFQIVHESNEDYIVMQFGRVNNDVFHMDFMYPLCALQAFGIALSSFAGKLACE